ncbi:hypothetical protein WR25_21986 [Diploscapter pachys]|uniref:Uncharacterized protein n=1 Tax=Diploscapter pachys TaxID=2018661 RepID=A0A2A2L9I5_9BILA|nr:hypothetical protein WR25_21986 [Diploscapter pachys]
MEEHAGLEEDIPEPSSEMKPVTLVDDSKGVPAQLQEVTISGQKMLVGYPGFDASMDFIVEDKVDLSKMTIKTISDQEHVKCTAVVIARFKNYTLMQTPLRKIGTIVVRRTEWKIPDAEELPQFGTWWWITIVKYANALEDEYGDNPVNEEYEGDINYMGIKTPKYINSKYHPFNLRMRGFARVVEFYFDFDLSKKGTCEMISFTKDFNTSFIYLLRHRLGLEVLVQKRYMYKFVYSDPTPNLQIEFWAVMRPVENTDYLFYLQTGTEMKVKAKDGSVVEVGYTSDDDDEIRHIATPKKVSR